jgi:hypothetical protein
MSTDRRAVVDAVSGLAFLVVGLLGLYLGLR